MSDHSRIFRDGPGKAKPLPSPETLRQLLRYEPTTGRLYWLERSKEWFVDGKGRYTSERNCKCWNTAHAGKEAISSIDPGLGYRKGSVLMKNLYAHRVIWAMQTGSWPDSDIDHINGDRADNRWSNLRSVSRSVNAKNACLRSNNTSGQMGVFWAKQIGRWRAVIWVDGKRISLGCFIGFEDAKAARKDAEIKHGFHNNHGRAA